MKYLARAQFDHILSLACDLLKSRFIEQHHILLLLIGELQTGIDDRYQYVDYQLTIYCIACVGGTALTCSEFVG